MNISPKENYIRALRHEKIAYIPLRSDSINFCPRIFPENVCRGWVEEKEKYTGPMGGKDMFGVEWIYMPEVGGSMVKPGNPTLRDISEWKEKLVFPDIETWDWEGCARENNEYLNSSGKFVETWIFTGLFERLISLLEFENAAMTMVDEDCEEDLAAFFQALTDLYCRMIVKIHETFPAVNAIYFHDDWGSQMAPFFSPAVCEEKLAPWLKKVVDCCHENGLFFDFHCCGKSEKLAPIMVACGVDSWCGQELNDKVALTKAYGDKMVIGRYDPFSYGGKIPADDEGLYAQINQFLEPLKDTAREKYFFIADMSRDPRVIRAYREITSKWFED